MTKVHGFKITAQDARQVDIPVESIRRIAPSTESNKSFIILKEPLSYTVSDRPTEKFNTVSDSSQNAVEIRFSFPRLKDMFEKLVENSVRSFDITSDTGPLSKYQIYTMNQKNAQTAGKKSDKF